MDILSIAIVLFIILETTNVLILYFKPGTKLGNGIGVFNAWEDSKKHPELHEFIRYMVYWVAGTKLIFIMLLLVILFTGSVTTKLWACIALIISIATFFFRLFPIIRGIDKRGEVTPRGYSKGLGIIIGSFMLVFALAVLFSIL